MITSVLFVPVNPKRTIYFNSGPYMASLWREIRSDIDAAREVAQARGRIFCEGSVLGRNVGMFLSRDLYESETSLSELPDVRCLEKISQMFFASGWGGNNDASGVISILTTGRLF